jgi:hypothetical protein
MVLAWGKIVPRRRPTVLRKSRTNINASRGFHMTVRARHHFGAGEISILSTTLEMTPESVDGRGISKVNC